MSRGLFTLILPPFKNALLDLFAKHLREPMRPNLGSVFDKGGSFVEFTRQMLCHYGFHAIDLKDKEELMTTIAWKKNVDDAFSEAKSRNIPVLLDFSAAPM